MCGGALGKPKVICGLVKLETLTLQCFAASKIGNLQIGAAEALLQLLQPVALGGHHGLEGSAVQRQVSQARITAHIHAENAG